MYRHLDDPFDSSAEHEAHQRPGRNFRALPLAVFTALIALSLEFFAIFLLGWGMAPTSVGCGPGRAAAISLAALAVSGAIFILAAGVGVAALADSRSAKARPRSFLIALATIYTVFSVPMLAFAALLGSCFNF